MKKAYACGTVSILLLAVVFWGLVRSGRNTGRYLTEASYGPFVYDGEIYVYSDLKTFPEERDTGELGFIQSGFLEAMFPVQEILRAAELLPVLIGDTEDTDRAYLKVRTDRDRPTARVSELETSGAASGGFSEKEYGLPAGRGRTGNERVSDKILSGSLPYSGYGIGD